MLDGSHQLRLDGVGRVFAGDVPTVALRDVSENISEADFVAVVGPSGGGKSTFLNIVGLLDSPTSGNYAIDGEVVAHSSQRRLAELRSEFFGFIFQSFHLLDRRPVIESVELALMYRGVRRSERRALALEQLKSVGLQHLAWQTANKLSGGERQRVAIARALSTGAPVIVADEPTGNLDSDNSDAIVRLLVDANKAGSTIVLVTHSTEVAEAAHRRVTIKDGRINAFEAPSQKIPMPGPVSGRGGNRIGKASTLRLADLVVDAMSSVASRVARSLGLVAAIAVGVALAVATFGISGSASAQVTDTFNFHANHDVTVTWDLGNLGEEPAAIRGSVISRLAALPGVDAAAILSYRGAVSVQAAPTRTAFAVDTYSGTLDTTRASRMSVTWAPSHEHKLASTEVLIGQNLAKQMNLAPLVGAPRISVGPTIVGVAGIITESPRVPEELGGILVSDKLGAALNPPERFQAMILTAPGAARQVAQQAPLVINPYDSTSLKVDAPTDPSTLRDQVQSEVRGILLAFTVIALLASVAGLANAMILSVIERKQEFGLRRAIGGRPIHVAGLVLTESLILGAVGGVVGLALGLASVLAVTLSKHWIPVFDFRIAPLAIVGGILVGALGGLLASIRASRVEPSEALRL